MGTQCSACVSSKKSIARLSSDFSNYPDDLPQYQSQIKSNLPKFKFYGVLSNIKIINYPKNTVSVKFDIPGVVQVSLPRKTKTSGCNQIKWVVKQNFDFVVDEYELRLKFLNITVMDEANRILENLKINFFKIATGPYHNDFSLFGSKSDTRIQFDLKVSQYVQMKFDCEETSAQICKKQYPGQSFYFTIRVLKQQKQQPFESNPSYINLKPYQDNKKSQILNTQYDECPSPIKIKGRQIPKVTKNSSSFLWKIEKGEMPHFKIFLKSHEIQKTILHLVIWRNESQIVLDDNESTNDQDLVDMFCEAYTPVTKVLQKDPILKKDSSRNLKLQERIIQLKNEGLWEGGQKIGQFSMKLRIENSLFIKQMKACTRTESGIIQSIPFFSNSYIQNKKENKTNKFNQIDQIMLKIQQLNREINQNKQLSNLGTHKLKNSMIEEFNKLQVFFDNNQQSSYTMPSNQNEALKMMDDQSFLLNTSLQIVSLSEDEDNLTDVCWRIILSIMRRGQFFLNNIGFSKNDQNQMKKNYSSYYKKKVKLGVQYQQVIYKLLLLSLKIGYIEGREDPRQSVEMFRAFCYFRVPEYRDILLKKVVKKQDQSIEWNTNIVDGDIQTIPEAQNIWSTQLDWENCFYKPLQIESKSLTLTKQLISNIQSSLWLEQISKRSSTFFYFLYFLVFRLSELNKKLKFIKCQYYPGYNKLVRGFLYQMKNLKIERYQKSLIQTSVNLLANEKLLNILVSIVLQKTNSNDCNLLMKGLDLISRYLNHFTKNKKLIPPTFNYVYFFKSIKIVLEGEFSFAIVKVLSIIFINYQNFNVEFKKNLSLYLLGKIFFKLFLSWSSTIRNAFYHTLLLKIQRSADIFDVETRKQFGEKQEIMNEIKMRYDQCLKIARNANQVHKQEIKTQAFKNHQKQLYKILRRKLANKKKKTINSTTENLDHKTEQIKLFKKQSSSNLNRDSGQKIAQKYSLKQLSKQNESQRSYSMLLDPTILTSIKQNFKLNLVGSRQDLEERKQTRTRSGTVNQDTSLEEWKDLNVHPTPKKLRQRKRSIFGNEDFDLKEIDQRQLEYLPIAIKQFDNLDSAIRKYYMENGVLPICDLDVEVPIDEKEIKPETADFEEWQGGEDD